MISPTRPSPTGGSLILNQAFPLTIKRKDVTALLCYICPTCPSPAEGSLILNQAFSLTIKGKDVTALLGARNRYALRLADHQRSNARLCGMGPHEGYWYLYRRTTPFGIFKLNSIPTLPSFAVCVF